MAAPPLFAPDEFDAALRTGRAVGVQQRLDGLAAFGLLAVLGLVGGAQRPHPLTVAQRREPAFRRDHVDQIGVDHDGDLRLGVRLGGERLLVVVEQHGVGEPRLPGAGAPEEDGLAVVKLVAGQRLHERASRASAAMAATSPALASATTSPMTSSAGPSNPREASPSPANVVSTRRSSARLAFSTIIAGVDPARPAAISRAAIAGAVERPM